MLPPKIKPGGLDLNRIYQLFPDLKERRASQAAYPVDSGSSICSVLSDRPRSVAGTYTDGQGALAF